MKELGRINPGFRAIVPIRLAGASAKTISLDATLDTGFTGFIALPRGVIEQLGLRFHSMTAAQLADGTVKAFRRFELRFGGADAIATSWSLRRTADR